jgi:carboxypeptidase C (cathepsin A)
METAGVRLGGVVLQSSVLDYSGNCGVITGMVSCAGYVPTYSAVGSFYNRVGRDGLDQATFLDQVRGFSLTSYDPAVRRYLEAATLPDASLVDVLARYTGITREALEMRFNFDPSAYQFRLIPKTVLGRYDARVSALVGTPLASGGDPSSNLITASFIGAIQPHLQTLKYSYASPYISLSNAINTWDFSHDGRALPDAVPDLAAALAQNPGLVVLSLNGYHDLATPFFQTERDLARLGPVPTLTIRNYDGGHMTYLDDNSRRLQRSDLVAMFRQLLVSPAAAGSRP